MLYISLQLLLVTSSILRDSADQFASTLRGILTIRDLFCPHKVRLHPSRRPTHRRTPPYRFEVMQLTTESAHTPPHLRKGRGWTHSANLTCCAARLFWPAVRTCAAFLACPESA